MQILCLVLILSFFHLPSGSEASSSCLIESLGSNSFVIRGAINDSELVVIGHYHRQFFVIENYAQAI